MRVLFWFLAAIAVLWIADDLRSAIGSAAIDAWSKITAFVAIEANKTVFETLGPIVAAFLGFLGGTLISHGLQMRRDTVARRRERRALLSGIHGELQANSLYLRVKLDWLRAELAELSADDGTGQFTEEYARFVLGGLQQEPTSEIYNSNITKLGALDPGDIGMIASLYSRLASDHRDLIARWEELASGSPARTIVPLVIDNLEQQRRLIHIATRQLAPCYQIAWHTVSALVLRWLKAQWSWPFDILNKFGAWLGCLPPKGSDMGMSAPTEDLDD